MDDSGWGKVLGVAQEDTVIAGRRLRDYSRTFASRQQEYHEVRIEPTTYKGSDAAMWEYTYSSGGRRLHAVNLGMVTGN